MQHVLGPAGFGFGARMHAGIALGLREFDQIGDEVDVLFAAARHVTERGAGMRADHHHEIREAFHLHAQEGARTGGPFVLQRLAADAADVDAVVAAEHGVEAGRIDDDVEFMILSRIADAGRRDALYGRVE